MPNRDSNITRSYAIKNSLKIVIWIIILFIFFKIFHDIHNNWQKLGNIRANFNGTLTILSIIILILHLFISASLWHLITFYNKSNIELKSSVTSWFYSLAGKYVPGKIFQFAGRTYYYSNRGVDIKQTTFCFTIEILLQFISSAFVMLIAYFSVSHISEFYKLSYVIPIILFALFIAHPKILQRIANTFLTIFHKNNIFIILSWKNIFFLFWGYFLNAILLGAAFCLFTLSFYQVDMSDYLYLVASFHLASWVGIMSLVAPGGIGVREGVLLIALRMIIPESSASIIVITARIWTTGTELFSFSSVYIYNALTSMRKSQLLPRDGVDKSV